MRELLDELLMILGAILSVMFVVMVVMIAVRVVWWLCEGILMGGWF